MTNTLTLQLGIPGFGTEPFGTVKWRMDKRFRLAHLFYVDVSLSLSETLFEDLPNEFLFAQTQLHAFDYLPMGHHQQFASVEVVNHAECIHPGGTNTGQLRHSMRTGHPIGSRCETNVHIPRFSWLSGDHWNGLCSPAARR